MKTLTERYSVFEEAMQKAVPSSTPAQRAAIKSTFMAGAATVLEMTMEIADLPVDLAAVALESVHREVRLYTHAESARQGSRRES